MPEQKSQRERHIPVFGIFLLFLGVVFLLQNFNVLPWALWETLWRFWPVLIIIIGLSILLKRWNPWLVSMVVLALLCACLGLAIWQYEPSLPVEETTISYSEPLGNLECAKIQLDFTPGSLTVGSLPSSSQNFIEVDSKARNGDRSVKADFHRLGNEGRLHLSTADEADTGWDIRLTRNIPLMMDIKSAVSSMELDLSQLEVTELRMDIDVGNYMIKMPSSAGITSVYIEADVANVEVTIPDGVAAKLKADVDLGLFKVDENRFLRRDDHYVSRNFDDAENRIELELDCDIGIVKVK